MPENWLNKINWSEDGLVPVVTQEISSNVVLMVAWMDREALKLTVETGKAVYWSRSRNQLWFKGEESGHVQRLEEIRLDCDSDVILLKVNQIGGIACHTGRRRCFFRVLNNGLWQVDEKIVKNPEEIYQ